VASCGEAGLRPAHEPRNAHGSRIAARSAGEEDPASGLTTTTTRGFDLHDRRFGCDQDGRRADQFDLARRLGYAGLS
jgi:hypothetical protein